MSDDQTATFINQDLYRLSVGILYLLLDSALASFPTTTRAHPSMRVVVYPVANLNYLRDSDSAYFPFSVTWNVWHRAVLPTIKEKAVMFRTRDNPSLRVGRTTALVNLPDIDRYLREIQATLRRFLEEGGFVPVTETPPDIGLAEGSPAPGAPVQYPRPEDDSGFQVFDVDDTLWPDGTVKLTYKTYDT